MRIMLLGLLLALILATANGCVTPGCPPDPAIRCFFGWGYGEPPPGTAPKLLPREAQDATPEPTPTGEQADATPAVEAPVVDTQPDVTVVIEQPPADEPAEPVVNTTVQSFLLTGVVFVGLAALTFVFYQQGQNLKVVAQTVPPEFAQFIFRLGMEQARKTELTLDDEALKTAAIALGYDVLEDGMGGFTIRASVTQVAQNAPVAKG